MSVTLLAAQTGAGNTSEFRIRGGNTGDKVTIVAAPFIVSAEECDLEQTIDGTTWLKVTTGIITATTKKFVLSDPGHYRVSKDITATATGIFLEGKAKLL